MKRATKTVFDGVVREDGVSDGLTTPAIHDPPSLPASPLPKRTKAVNPQPAAAQIEAVLEEDGTATPTPTTSAPDPVAMATATATSSSLASSTVQVPLLVQLLSQKGRAPTRGSAFAAGYDVYSAQQTVVPARGKALVETDISIAVPIGTYGRIAPRSGLAAKHSIDVGAGVIDSDYRGPLKILLFNLSDSDFAVTEGERIAQLILERIYTPEVMVVDKLEETVRGVGGFGSTGGFAGVV